jgi:hypothetical protein
MLKDVATGNIMQSGNRMFHGGQMPSNVLRVQVALTLRGCDHVMPPFQLEGDEDEELKALRQFFGHIMLWPKSQIRLGAGSTAPCITPPIMPGPSHVVADPDPDMQMAHDPNDDDDDVDVDAYINTAYCDGLDDLEGPSDK